MLLFIFANFYLKAFKKYFLFLFYQIDNFQIIKEFLLIYLYEQLIIMKSYIFLMLNIIL